MKTTQIPKDIDESQYQSDPNKVLIKILEKHNARMTDECYKEIREALDEMAKGIALGKLYYKIE